jgi:hypothetical protein
MKQQTPTITTTIGTDNHCTSVGTYLCSKGTVREWRMTGGLSLIVEMIDDLRATHDIECRHIVQRLA